jgi:hypothetical protein
VLHYTLAHGSLVIDWAGATGGAELEVSTDPTRPDSWALLGLEPTYSQGRFRLPIPTSTRSRFFRLHLP